MRLIDPGVGEITDRLTILSLKLLMGAEQGKDVTHFKTEQTALLAKIRSRTLNGVWFEQVLTLAAVNAALWHAEDQLREMRINAPLDRVGKVAIRIQSLNDRRAELVALVNANAGDHPTPKEKL